MLTRRHSGFSLIELMVAVSVMAVLTAVAMPNFTTWIRNARMRTVADALQSGLRLAQGEAQRRTHNVVFFLTTSKACDLTDTATAGGLYWQIRTVPMNLLANDPAEVVQCGVLTDVSSGVQFQTSPTAPPTALCFSGDGRQTTLTDPTTIGANCTAGAAAYNVVSATNGVGDRPLRVLVSLAGSIRMCDPGKASTAPDGCP
ncbi:GspH/FimT family pseudopilin [Roseateles sp. NT4]|uniref:GspH/FimT family pseudopilin n=1 Tax=Roseateles sp. NT4 TaxID=3453715 RepID=UPI003EEC3095